MAGWTTPDRSELIAMSVRERFLCLAIVAASSIVASPTLVSCAATRLQGAGATFPAPFYKRLVVVYQQQHPDVLIDYQSIGSGGGIKAITDKTVHFCASDAPMSKKELAATGGEENIVEIPSCAGGIVPIYNVPGVDKPLKFSGELLADIYLGKVTQWNDPAIARMNPEAQLPDLSITPVWRTDGSGTTFIFTNYLATQSENFALTRRHGQAGAMAVRAGWQRERRCDGRRSADGRRDWATSSRAMPTTINC